MANPLGSRWDFIHMGNIRVSKLINLVKRLIFYKKQTVLNYYPLSYIVDPSTVCNLKCPYCMQGQYDDKVFVKREFMTMENYKIILSKIKDYAINLQLYNYGEPLIHPQISEMIRLAKNEGMRVRISTNLAMELSDIQIEELVKSGLYRLTCAIDGPTQEVFEKYRVGGNLENVKRNARRIVESKNRLGMSTPLLVYRMLVFEWNHDYIEQSRALAKELGFDRFYLQSGHFTIDDEKVVWDYKKGGWLKQEKRRRDENVERTSGKGCHWLFNTMVIGANGKNLVCCTNDKVNCEHRSLITDSLYDIWNDMEYVEARKASLGLIKSRNRILETCKTCKDL